MTGTVGNIILEDTGVVMNFTRAGTTWLHGSNSGGAVGVVTDGRVLGDVNANVMFLSDKSSAFYGAMLPTTIVTDSSWALVASPGMIIPRGFYNFSQPNVTAVLEQNNGGVWRAISSEGAQLSDGINLRIYSTTGSGTQYYNKF